MQTFTFFSLSVLLLSFQSSRGFLLGSQKHFIKDFDNIGYTESSTLFKNSDAHSNTSSYGIYNSTSEYRSGDANSESLLVDENTSDTEASAVNISQSSDYSTSRVKSESGTSNSDNGKMVISTEASNNESHSNTLDSTSKPSLVTTGSTQTSSNRSTLFIVTPTSETKGLSPSSLEPTDEPEGVVIDKPVHNENGNTTESSEIKTLYARAMELISDTYTLSILLPVAAGVVFASTIIVTIATCRCLRRRCRRSRVNRKTLPDSVKTIRPSDRARLLAESSDEEF